MTKARDLSDVVSNAGWTSYTPTFSGGTWAVGNGTFQNTRYIQIGKTVHVKGQFTFGSTTVKSASNGLLISLPVTAGNANGVGSCTFLDSGTNWYVSSAILNSADTFQPVDISVSGSKLTWSGVVSTGPFTWATNDLIIWTVTYEAA